MSKTRNSTAAAAPAEPQPVAEFEQALGELEGIVARMEEGELSLDDSLGAFERGIALYRQCQQALDQAELKVRLLLDPNDPGSATPFDADAT
jgi:exodeoxyribonuclease VII small subunit